jgi:hypothetical protein
MHPALVIQQEILMYIKSSSNKNLHLMNTESWKSEFAWNGERITHWLIYETNHKNTCHDEQSSSYSGR